MANESALGGKALLSKISQLLSNPANQQFVSFLTLAEAWDMREVAFDLPSSVTGISDKDSANLRGAFARHVNRIPALIDVWSPSPEILWNVYRDVMQGAVRLAKIPDSGADDARIQAALALIGKPDAPTPQYQAYKNYRDRYFALDHNLRLAELTLANATDPQVKAQAQADHDQYSTQLNALTQDWIANGSKAEIEGALNTLSQAYARSTLRNWTMWQDDFLLVTSQRDGSGEFWPCGYRPAQLYDAGIGWVKFTLSGDEVASLAASAPPAVLRTQDSLGDAVRAGGEIQQMSMEVARVDVERTWFHPEIFASRFWDWSLPDQLPLSDGAQPTPKGRLPGYVIGLVLVRNISITWEKPPSTATDPSSFRVLGNLALRTEDLREGQSPVRVQPLPGEMIRMADPSVTSAVTEPANVEALTRPAIRVEALDALATSPTVSANLADTIVSFQPSILTASVSVAPRSRIPAEVWVPEPQPTPPQPAPPNQPPPADAVYMVGYIVQRTPKSPDPDQALVWS